MTEVLLLRQQIIHKYLHVIKTSRWSRVTKTGRDQSYDMNMKNAVLDFVFCHNIMSGKFF